MNVLALAMISALSVSPSGFAAQSRMLTLERTNQEASPDFVRLCESRLEAFQRNVDFVRQRLSLSEPDDLKVDEIRSGVHDRSGAANCDAYVTTKNPRVYFVDLETPVRQAKKAEDARQDCEKDLEEALTRLDGYLMSTLVQGKHFLGDYVCHYMLTAIEQAAR